MHFEESVKMSTYVVAFVVHDFKSISSASSRGVKVHTSSYPFLLSELILNLRWIRNVQNSAVSGF